jgi:hypothetical protein
MVVPWSWPRFQWPSVQARVQARVQEQEWTRARVQARERV